MEKSVQNLSITTAVERKFQRTLRAAQALRIKFILGTRPFAFVHYMKRYKNESKKYNFIYIYMYIYLNIYLYMEKNCNERELFT